MADNVSCGSRSADDFLTAISDVIEEGLKELLHGTKYVSILIDESTDIKTEKKLLVYTRFVNINKNILIISNPVCPG